MERERERDVDAREAESSVDRGVDCRSVRTLEPVDRETAGGLALGAPPLCLPVTTVIILAPWLSRMNHANLA